MRSSQATVSDGDSRYRTVPTHEELSSQVQPTAYLAVKKGEGPIQVPPGTAEGQRTPSLARNPNYTRLTVLGGQQAAMVQGGASQEGKEA